MTTTDTAGTSTQVYQLYIRAAADEVWKAITDPATVALLLRAATRSALRGGRADPQLVTRREPAVGGQRNPGVRSARRLVHSWRSLYDPELAGEPESRVTWEIEAQADGLSRLTVIHDRLDGSPRTAASERGWSYILSNLKTVIETGEPLPPIA